MKTSADRNGAVTITLHTTKDDVDETAEVKVELSNPEAVVQQMLHTLAHKFPPESVMTIATQQARGGGSEESSSIESSSVNEGFSPVSEALRAPQRLSGRHYLSSNGEYYPELADTKGRPIAGYVRDPHTGSALPVGRPAHGADGKPIPGMISGEQGTPIPGIPIPASGMDPQGNPWPCYEAVDGSYPREATGSDGRPLLGFAICQIDGQIKRVGPAVIGPDGHPLKGMIRGPSDTIMDGIPLKPVQRPSNPLQQQGSMGSQVSTVSSRFSKGQPTGEQYHSPNGRPVPGMIIAPDGSPIRGVVSPKSNTHRGPSYTGIDGSRVPMAFGPNGDLLAGFTRDKDGSLLPVGPALLDDQGRPIPGFIVNASGQPTRGVAVVEEVSSPTACVTHRQEMHRNETADSYASQSAVKIPAPCYPLIDGTFATLAVGPDGRPVDGYSQDPKTGDLLPVGPAFYHNGRLVPGMILGKHGEKLPGFALAPHGYHEPTQQAIPHYLTCDGSWAPMYLDNNGNLIHGWARDPRDGQMKPVGLQVVNEAGVAVDGLIMGPDGRPVKGLPLDLLDSESQPEAPQHIHTNIHSNINSNSNISNKQTFPSSPGYPSGTVDQDGFLLRYVEVPVVEEKIVHVKGKREVREIEKRVPKHEVVEVVKEVQIPQIQYVEKKVEVVQIEEVLREVRVKQVVDRPREVVVRKPKIETQIVEKLVEVPGQIIEVPRVERHEQPVYVPRYVDREVPTVVAQKLQPLMREVSTVRKVPCMVTEPNVIRVDVFVPKPVMSTLGATGKVDESNKTVEIPAAQYNALTKRLNMGIDQAHVESLFVRDGAGIPILPAGERVETVEPVCSDWIQRHEVGHVYCSNATEVPQLHIHETLGIESIHERDVSSRRHKHSESSDSRRSHGHRSRRHHKHHHHRH